MNLYFIEPYTKTKISFSRVYNANEFRWKDKDFPLQLAYNGPGDDEDFETYTDLLELLNFYRYEQ